MMCTVACLGIPVLLFPGGGLSKGFRFLVAWVRLLLECRFGCVLMVPKDHLGDRLPAGTTSPVRWGARWWRARFSLPWCESLYDSESTYVVVQGGSIFSVCHVDVLYWISDYKPRMLHHFNVHRPPARQSVPYDCPVDKHPRHAEETSATKSNLRSPRPHDGRTKKQRKCGSTHYVALPHTAITGVTKLTHTPPTLLACFYFELGWINRI